MIVNLRYNYFTRLKDTVISRIRLSIEKLVEEQDYENEKSKTKTSKLKSRINDDKQKRNGHGNDNGKEDSLKLLNEDRKYQTHYLESFKDFLNKKLEGDKILYFKSNNKNKNKNDMNQEALRLSTKQVEVEKVNLYTKFINDLEVEKENIKFYEMENLIEEKINILKVRYTHINNIII